MREKIALRFQEEQSRQSGLPRLLPRGTDLNRIRVEATVCVCGCVVYVMFLVEMFLHPNVYMGSSCVSVKMLKASPGSPNGV